MVQRLEQEERCKDRMEVELKEQAKLREVLVRVVFFIQQENLEKEEMLVEEEEDIMVREVLSVMMVQEEVHRSSQDIQER
jgi:hypothetical protein